MAAICAAVAPRSEHGILFQPRSNFSCEVESANTHGAGAQHLASVGLRRKALPESNLEIGSALGTGLALTAAMGNDSSLPSLDRMGWPSGTGRPPVRSFTQHIDPQLKTSVPVERLEGSREAGGSGVLNRTSKQDPGEAAVDRVRKRRGPNAKPTAASRAVIARPTRAAKEASATAKLPSRPTRRVMRVNRSVKRPTSGRACAPSASPNRRASERRPLLGRRASRASSPSLRTRTPPQRRPRSSPARRRRCEASP